MRIIWSISKLEQYSTKLAYRKCLDHSNMQSHWAFFYLFLTYHDFDIFSQQQTRDSTIQKSLILFTLFFLNLGFKVFGFRNNVFNMHSNKTQNQNKSNQEPFKIHSPISTEQYYSIKLFSSRVFILLLFLFLICCN